MSRFAPLHIANEGSKSAHKLLGSDVETTIGEATNADFEVANG